MKRSQNAPDHEERVRIRNRLPSRNRGTSAGNEDMPIPAAPPRKRDVSRMSLMPNQSDAVKKIKLETNNELNNLYYKYLQTKMEMLILKKQSENRENDVETQLVSLTMEREKSEKKLAKIQMRKIEMSSLDEIQKILDKQFTEIKKSIENFDAKVEDVLEQMSLVLKARDYLSCKNSKIPQADGELKIFQSALIRTIDIMAKLNQMIETNSSTIVSGGRGLKTFADTHEKLVQQLKPLECNLQKLQVEILSRTSVELK